MKKIAQSIVRLRKLILTVAVLLLIPSAIGAVATRINYDVLTYLPQELDSMIGEVALEDDFHLASTGMITVEGLPTNELIAMKKDIDAVPGVTQTFWLSDVIDPSIPTEMLPADVQQFMFGKNDSTMLIVRFDAPSASDETMNAVQQIKQVLRHDCYFGGMSVILQDTKALINKEMPLYILCAVGASMLVLFLSLESTITPVLFMLGLLFPIAYNFGTNIFLGQISYITQALSTVLQLGVTMDFSIFLLHRYQEEKELRSSNEEAMVTAICKTMTSITASSLTTIAGFLALCAMRLTLGRDIGVVMAKGVALGVICTIVILPALILTFDQQVEKYKHRTIVPKLTKLSYFVSKHAMPIVVVFLVLLVPFVVAQQKTEVYYTLFDSLPQDLTGIVGTNKLGEDFGMTTSHFILVDEDLTATQVSDLCDELKDVDGITQVVSLDSITGPGFQTELLPDSVTEILQSGGYKLILANSSYKTGTDAINNQLTEMNDLIKAVDPNGVITGEGAMTKDLIEVADVDFKNVNVWSIMAVAAIILISFRSLSIPVLLVASIEAAISINMGIPYFTGTQLPFIASIVIGTIQLGATVDYSILMTTRYHEERSYGRTPRGDLRATLLNMGMQEGAQYLIREYGLPLTEESYFSVMREVIAELYETVELKPGVRTMLAKLQAEGARMCICSNTWAEQCRTVLTRLGIAQYFSFIVEAQGVLHKSRPEVFFECMSRLGGADPAACAVCEDAVYAAATAHKAGYYVIGIADRTSAADEPEMRRICSQFVPRWDALDWTRV
jgi:HAD superfamily hydrolase (TIGR01509 family)